MPQYCYNQAPGYTNGEMFAVTKNSTGTYLNGFSIYPYQKEISVKINMSKASGVEYYGKLLYQSQAVNVSRVLIYNDTSVVAYSPFNGTMMWNDRFKSLDVQNGVVIPSFYQVSIAKNNSAYVLVNKSEVYSMNLGTGNSSLIYRFPYPADSISTTLGTNGLHY